MGFCHKIATALLIIVGFTVPILAQRQGADPSINEKFLEANVKQWVERFEREGRDVFDKRHDVVAACQLKPGMVVADVGAGTGLFTGLFSPAVGPKGLVCAVDISKKFVDSIEERCREQGLRNVKGIVCTSDDSKLPADSVDVVYICDTYHHFEAPPKTLASIHRALKPGGRLVLVDFERIEGKSSEWLLKHVRAGKEVFRKEIEQAGFKFVDELPMFEEKYLLRFERVAAAETEQAE